MAFKFPFTNYHELNLTWVLDQLKALFEKSEENVTVIENYNGRLTAVETELPLVEETAQGAAQQAAGAATLAQQAKSTADTAQENAIQAQGLAGTARQEAQAAQSAADAATQAAQQAQATAQNFDGRITQAENDASQALEASRSFENRVQSAITTANNAAQTATNAQGIATRADQNAARADQNAARALDTLNAQRSELERIGREQAALITEKTESGKTEIENLAQSVLDSIPSDYTALSNLVDKKAPVIINNASGSIASFDDGADNMKIQKLLVNIEPAQSGSGWTGASVTQIGRNWLDISKFAEKYPNYCTYSNNTLTVTTVLGEMYSQGIDCFIPAGAVLNATITDGTATNVRLRIVHADGTVFDVGQKDMPRRIVKDAIALRLNWSQAGSFSISNACALSVATAAEWEYVPYTRNQISVTFPSAAGTVYSGTITLNPDSTGMLVVNRADSTPQTFQLTESEISGILTTLYGTNNIWADTGPVSVDYPADTKLYIDGKLAELQATILENI